MDENTFLKQKVDVLNGELNKLQLRSQSSSSNQAQNPSAGNDQNDEQDGGNDQNDEQDGGNDQNDAQDEDSDPSSGDESTDEGFMTVFIIRDFDINKSYEVAVKPSWRLKTLKSVIVQKWNVCVNDLVFSTGGRTLIPSLTFIDKLAALQGQGLRRACAPDVPRLLPATSLSGAAATCHPRS